MPANETPDAEIDLNANNGRHSTKKVESSSKKAKKVDHSGSTQSTAAGHLISAKPRTAAHRRSHNIIEKGYRNRLHWQFDQLLALLPIDLAIHQDKTSGGQATTRVSKAKVLDLARHRIYELEKQRDMKKLERAYFGEVWPPIGSP
jgi:hypothetical protein